MKRFLRSKLALSLTAFIMLAASIVIPLSGSITHSHAASRSSHNIAYVNYDDSGFTGSSIPSANIFTDAIVGGPSPTSSPTDSVTYNGMTFTPLAKAALSSTTLAAYDTLILFEVCDIATSLTASQHTALNNYLAAGNKILLYDADRCAPGNGGNADYSWFTFPFATSNPGPKGASGTLTIVEASTLTNGLASDPFSSDELGDANTATTSDPHWFAAAKTTNALGNNGYFLAYARNKGLIIYDGADRWFTIGPTKSLTDLFLNELNQQYDPDNLPGTVPIASPTPPTGEPKFPLASSQVTSSTTPSGTIVTAKTDAPCTTPTLLATLQKGEVVNIEADAAVTHGEDPFHEQGEKEFLKIYDVAADIIQPVDYLASRIFSFTATSNNDNLKACILPGTDGDGPDGDELGTISVTITPASAPEPTPIQDQRLTKVFFCLLDVAQVGELVKIVGKGAQFAQFEGKVFKVLNYTYTGLSTFVATVQDIKTGQILEVGWALFTALPLGSCLDLIRDLTPIRPVA